MITIENAKKKQTNKQTNISINHVNKNVHASFWKQQNGIFIITMEKNTAYNHGRHMLSADKMFHTSIKISKTAIQ